MDLRAEPGLFSALAGWRSAQRAYVGLSTQKLLAGASVTAGMFSGVLRVQPFLGRTFLPEEDRPGAAPTVVLSHGFWSEELGADPDAIGRSVVLDGASHVVVGIMPPGFRAPFAPEAEVWTPARLDRGRCRTGCRSVTGIGRLATGATLEVARDRAAALGTRLSESYPETNQGLTPAVERLTDRRTRMSSATTRLLMFFGGFVLLLACCNVALLLLARGVDRVREMGIRSTVGASKAALVRQILGECAGLVVVGSLLGVGVAAWALEALRRVAPSGLLDGTEVRLDLLVLAWVALLTAATALLSGVLPALVAARAGAGTRGVGYPSAAFSRVARWVGGGIGALQLGFAMALVLTAGGLLRSLQHASEKSLGFDPVGVVTIAVDLAPSPFSTGADRWERAARVGERLAEIPGVFALGAASSLPFEEAGPVLEIRLKDERVDRGIAGTAGVRSVSPAYFYTLEQRVAEGRWFHADDEAESPPVAILSATAVRRIFGDSPGSPLGTEIALADEKGAWRTVVGVVRDEWADSELRAAEAVVYVPLPQRVPEAVRFVARVDGDLAAVIGEIRETLGETDVVLQSAVAEPLGRRIDAAFAAERFAAMLASAFALTALLLALLGLFGILAHAAVARAREWGLRRAVGATDQEVRARIFARALALTASGVVVGGLGVGLLADSLDAVFSNSGLRTPTVYAAAATALCVVALLAGVWPANRAVTSDVVAALRVD